MNPIEQIRAEHRHIGFVLDRLEEEIGRGRAGKTVDWAFISRAARFFVDVVDGTHHAKEVILFRCLRHGPLDIPLLQHLAEDHADGAEHAGELFYAAEAAAAGLEEAEVVLEMAEDYVIEQRRHMDLEERRVLPVIERLRGEEELRTLERRFEQLDKDSGLVETHAITLGA